MRHQIFLILSLFPFTELVVSSADSASAPESQTAGVVRVSPITAYSPEVLSTENATKWEGETLTLRFADRVDRKFVRVKDPAGARKTLYFGILQKSLPYIYANGEIFGFHFFSVGGLQVFPTLRAAVSDDPTNPSGPNLENWEELEALMEDGLRKHPQSTGNCYPDSRFLVNVPLALAFPPRGYDRSDIVSPRIFSVSMKQERLLIDYDIAEYGLKARVEIDLNVRPWKIVRAWKNGVPIDLEADLRERERRDRLIKNQIPDRFHDTFFRETTGRRSESR